MEPASFPRLAALRWILGLGILSTAIHFTHNFVAIDQYPRTFVSGPMFCICRMAFRKSPRSSPFLDWTFLASRSASFSSTVLCAFYFARLFGIGDKLDISPLFETIDDLRERADEICAHRFDLLGSGPTDLGPEIDFTRRGEGRRGRPRTSAFRTDRRAGRGSATIP